MPELPDVEGYRRYLARFARDKPIRAVEAPAADLLRNTSPQGTGRALVGRSFAAPRRHGKWLIAPTDGPPVVLMHFGMTGRFQWAQSRQRRHRHDRVIFAFDDGELRYRNMRKLGGVWLAPDQAAVGEITGPLGPDAMELSPEGFERILSGRRGGLKATLMNQKLLAGIGNELSDEILWRARLHPARSVATLRASGRRRLYAEMHDTIDATIRRAHIPRARGWLTEMRGRREARCPRCDSPLRRSQIAGRTSLWCPRCQRQA